MKASHAIVDLQFGSTGKGLLAGHLGLEFGPDVVVTAWGPNAGHTFVNAEGEEFVNIALPSSVLAKPKFILLGPGSVINPDILIEELERYAPYLQDTSVLIHEHAAIVNEGDRMAEREYGYAIGSTMKGVGEAVCRKIRRHQPFNVAKEALRDTQLWGHIVRGATYEGVIRDANELFIEGAQGYSLGINSGFYPFVTSRECTIAQLAVDCLIPADRLYETHVYGVARTYPIRVANRFNKDGQMVGTSGPCYEDQRELEWKEIGREAELTTVTKLPRRIFTWSHEQINRAVHASGVEATFLNFCNYMVGDNIPEDQPGLGAMMETCKKAGAPVRWAGYGPSTKDIVGV